MLNDVSRFVRAGYKALGVNELVTKPVECLLGVTAPAKQALAQMGIITVFDLASSPTFATANELVLAGMGASTGLAQYGRAPGELVDDDARTVKLIDLPLMHLDTLRNIGPPLRQALEAALDVETIRDFALWPPYHAARSIFSSSYGLDGATRADGETPSDLIPANGQYPTERVHYECLIFDEFTSQNSQGAPVNLQPGVAGSGGAAAQRMLGSDGPLDVSVLLAGIEGYERPAIGGVLTFTQSWYTKGLALGNLIHGVALGPGESTKIAIIDWSRTTRTSATEAISEDEALISNIARSRAISEITSAVARETQEGRSAAHSESTFTERGSATGSASFLTDLLSLPGVNTSGTSFGTSSGSTDATSWSTSSGQRDLAARLNQDIVDRTQQASHSARNRRASIVREVTQTESERLSTRTLTNYNHMHALTVEYYEVVQLYRTVVELTSADRCLFVPMKLIDFRNASLVDRYRGALSAAALTPEIREALDYPSGTTRVKAPSVTRVGLPPAPVASSPPTPLDDLSPDSFNARDVREAQIATGGIVRILPDGRLVLPHDAVLYDIDFVTADQAIKPVALTLGRINGATATTIYGQTGWDMSDKRTQISDLASLTMTASGVSGSGKVGFVSVIFQFKSKGFRIVFPVKLEADAVLPVLYAATVPSDVMGHLQDNRLYYSQAIWRSLDPATIGILLSGYTWRMSQVERPLAEIVDPTPVAIVANYVVLRLSGDDEGERTAWLARKKITLGSTREDLVPVPSGGVFGEAVLGRSNSAERLDLTRFWNWQDSPIPISAPDIAALQSGSRREADNTTPGQLGQPVLNIVNAPSLPDPQGMGAVLAAIQNGQMFRDMSGLAGTIGLAQAGLAGAQQGASNAAVQAGQNAAVAAQLGERMAEIAGKLVAAYFSGGASLGAGGLGGGSGGIINNGQGISKAGSLLNYARDMDQRGMGQTPSGQAVPSAAASAPDPVRENAAFDATVGSGTRSGGPLGILNEIMGGTATGDAGVTAASRSLVGDPAGPLDLSKAMMDYLGSLVGPDNGTCVAVSLINFTSAMRALGVQTLTVPTDAGGIEVPSIATQNGTVLSARALAAIWYSNTSATSWSKLPTACRGAGAPGALLYGDLIEGRNLNTSKVGWPRGMTPGAHLQLWRNEEEYKDLRDNGIEPTLGHSCIFQAYVEGDAAKIVVADQMGVAHEVKYPYFGLKFVIAGNLSKARILSGR